MVARPGRPRPTAEPVRKPREVSVAASRDRLDVRAYVVWRSSGHGVVIPPGPEGKASACLRDLPDGLLIERHLAGDALVGVPARVAEVVDDQAGLDGVALELVVVVERVYLLGRAVDLDVA